MIKFQTEHKELLARICDLCDVADSGVLAMTQFLTPAEAFCAKEIINDRALAHRACLFGGYADAERARLVILPMYLDGCDGEPTERLFEYFPDEAASAVCALKITGSGYKSLTHRDYLGSILSLGIERDAVGDIITIDDRSAYAFAAESVAKLLLSSLERVGNDKVTVESIALDRNFSVAREYESIADTVASARLDCVVAALANLSRDRAQTLIESGACLLCYAEETRCDRAVSEGDIITVRGHGKFIIRKINEKTKKGRLRLIADKYV